MVRNDRYKTAMNLDEGLMQKLALFFTSFKLPLIIGFIGLICLGYGLIDYFFQNQSKNEIVFTSENTSAVETASVKNEIVVHIGGAVVNPGVYYLPEDTRLQEGIEKAGGLAENADSEFVEKQFNLALKLKDGMKIYVPAVGEAIGSAAVAGVSTNTGSMGITGENTNLININTASESELDRLPGIGKVTAEKIINNRPYGSVEELLDKKIVKQKVFEEIKEQITAY